MSSVENARANLRTRSAAGRPGVRSSADRLALVFISVFLVPDAVHLYNPLGRWPATDSETTHAGRSDIRYVRARLGLAVKCSAEEIAGRYADQGRFVLTETGRHVFPPPVEMPALLGDRVAWLPPAPDTPATAFSAHRRLVNIHPFNGENGRAACLLMNVVLLRGGYPPIAVRPEDRPAYIGALRQPAPERFDRLLHERLDPALDQYLSALMQALPASGREEEQRRRFVR